MRKVERYYMHHESDDTETKMHIWGILIPATQSLWLQTGTRLPSVQQQEVWRVSINFQLLFLALTDASAPLSNADIQKSPAAKARSAIFWQVMMI
jgi:hypothetical protein